eukprot:TRINITY_DN30719_c0_g1_i1.p1 TRINITY_DN30719_c0_g1~~TRINITY_DN30719_c0_g1_i1.p1  ORF type:complete len:417 (+),score=111.23 TRINITY_DN30719_c0_g1_i1:109-1359(+)
MQRARVLCRWADAQTSEWIERLVPRRAKDQDHADYLHAMKNIRTRLRFALDQRRAKGDDVGVKSYTTCVELAARSVNDNAAWALFEDMHEHGVAPSRETFLWLMWASAQRGDVAKATAAWRKMRRLGLARMGKPGRSSPDASRLLTTLVMAYGAAGDEAGAFRIARSLQLTEGVLLNERALSALARACATFPRAMETVRWGAHAHGVALPAELIGHLLRKCTGVAEARELLGYAKGVGVAMPNEAYAQVLLAYRKEGDMEGVLVLAKHMAGEGLMTVRGYINLLKALANGLLASAEAGAPMDERYLAVAVAAYQQAHRAGLQKHRDVNVAMLKCYAAAGRLDAAERIRAAMRDLGQREPPSVPDAMAAAYRRAGRTDAPSAPPPCDRSPKNYDVVGHMAGSGAHGLQGSVVDGPAL